MNIYDGAGEVLIAHGKAQSGTQCVGLHLTSIWASCLKLCMCMCWSWFRCVCGRGVVRRALCRLRPCAQGDPDVVFCSGLECLLQVSLLLGVLG